MIIAIDFDGTIVEHKYPQVGDIRKDAKEVITKLYNEGHGIVIWTCRYTPSDLNNAKHFLALYEIPYHAINTNVHDTSIFNPKPKIYADVYIDDRNIGGLPTWKEIYKIIHNSI